MVFELSDSHRWFNMGRLGGVSGDWYSFQTSSGLGLLETAEPEGARFCALIFQRICRFSVLKSN